MDSKTKNTFVNPVQVCQNCQAFFEIDAQDFAFYEKIKVPPPTFCAECRMVRRFVFRNERQLFRRKDEVTGKEIFSGLPPQVKAKVYEIEYWNSDNWDPYEYGREYDFSRPFFEQFKELLYDIPWPAKSVQRMVNSDYCDNASGFKNCYLCFAGDNVENSAYTVRTSSTKDSLDLFESHDSELCVENYMVDECYKVLFSVNCENCTDVWFSKDLVGCSNCFGCVNLRNKQYYIFNKPYTKEGYKEYLKSIDLGSYQVVQKLRNEATAFWQKFPARFTLGIRNVNSTGEHVQNSKNVHSSFCIHGGENLKYCQNLLGPATDSHDYTNWGIDSSFIYESLTCGEGCYGLKFCYECWPACRDLEYSAFCRSCENLFGCVGLKKAQYCIFNKRYSKQDYHALREKIIQQMKEMPYISKFEIPNSKSETNSNFPNNKSQTREITYKYGEFFPSEFSPYAYNETIAQDFFELTKEQAQAKGFLWREQEKRQYKTTMEVSQLPDNIKNAEDSITKEIINCPSCSGAFRIVPLELNLYRRLGIPLPRICHNCRFKERFKFINPPKLWNSKCQCAGAKSDNGIYFNSTGHHHGKNHCPNEFETSYAPGRPEIVYCETCYQSEVA